MTQDEKLDEALKGTFPASDAFYLSPDKVRPVADDREAADTALRSIMSAATTDLAHG